ncbi:uncharacterized protein N0V89_009608 [Didymosphaeria variabile]|uniref:Uncharacterized protein n=1 Tax=Didymosphaeria variabile TaxID=1932322 RepID=A0A9W9C7G0_9PLEO|nr:uncharacterized protein N0V89_009608 [Didymosphaeria variabile]KAJ4348236.1 hypothetical protein N0V89_009608 [Didymosphaeria variabile]
MALIPFTPDADNTSMTTINGVHFNIRALSTHHYSFYTNNTISNGSECYLVFDAFKPRMLDNGTWLHATTCYIPYYGISSRGATSIALGVLFGLSIMFTLMNLKKHGAQHLREDKRFRLVGRRWQWYWMLFVSASATISLFTGVDVDRYYLQQMPIMLQCFFFTLMVPAGLASVWEGTRHWGSWEERQVVDADPYGLSQIDRRAKIEFYTPLIFYLFAWLNFFLTIPRSWTGVQRQNSPEQTMDIARPLATDLRNKAGAILAVAAWATILFSLTHSLRAYKNSNLAACPKKLLINVVLLGIRLAYGIAASFSWSISLFNQAVPVTYPFALGYAPFLLILLTYNGFGFLEKNEDKQIVAQRVARGRAHDAELNLVKKPNWWSRNMVARFADNDQRLRDMTAEIGGGRPTARNLERAVEMGNMNVRQRSESRPVQDPFRDESPEGGKGRGVGTGTHLKAGGPSVAREVSETASTRMGKTGQKVTSQFAEPAPQQRFRSMLDV